MNPEEPTRMSLGDLVEFNTKQLNNFIVAVDVQLITNTNGNPNNQTVTKLLKDEISSSFNKIAAISNPYEFEDLVFILLRLIGITNIYQYDRNHCAGAPDGLFVYGKFAVAYDCTLRNPFQPHKNTQIFNYKSQLKANSSITIQLKSIDGKSREINVPLPSKREVWIITRDKTRLIEEDDGIYVREISINTLFDMLDKSLSVKFSGQLNK